jgi:CheY-like chemotaxis protein
MPRLLLVDDNPSIHRIAESLLAPTDVELVCVDSAAEALDRIERGERFDVALVDTAMPGMDGWTLLTRLRSMEATARMPIALMAGVLDPVDPAKLARAPIQGFLKKPIELRELGDRVKALLVAPVPVSPSPFSTVPATPASELMKRVDPPLPEFRPDVELEPEAQAEAMIQAGFEEDLLLLTVEDLWPEEPALAATPAVAAIIPDPIAFPPDLSDVHLELEELDLDSLQDLTGDPLPDLPAMAEERPEPAFDLEPLPDLPSMSEERPEPAFDFEPLPDLPSMSEEQPEPAFNFEPLPDLPSMSEEQPEPAFDFEPLSTLSIEEEHLVTLSGLEELEALQSDFDLESPSPAVPDVVAPEDEFAHLPAAALLIALAEEAPAAGMALAEPATAPAFAAHESPAAPLQEPAAPLADHEPVSPAASGQAPAVPGHSLLPPKEPVAVSAEQARAVVHAMLADPVLVDALVKAVVARMGDQVLREIAWEVMPELAGKLQK